MENELPEGWAEVKIDELTTIIAGGTPSTSVKEYFEGDIPWITPADLSGYRMKYISSGRKSISKLGLANSSARLLPKGSVLFSSRAPIGYVAIAANELATNQGFKSLTPNKAFDSSFAYYYLKHIKDYAESQASGTTFKELSGSKMGQLPFLLAPLAEQTRIVAKLDAAFGHLETLKMGLARIPELLKKFRQTVLTQAVTGKLTESWREDNPDVDPSKTLNLIQKRKANKQKSIQIFKDDAASPFEIPNEWTFLELRDLSYNLSYGTSEKSLNEGLVPVLRMGNLQNGKIDWTDLKYTTSSSEIKKYALKKGNVLFNRTNSPELVGKTSIYEGELPAIYAGYLIKIENYEELNSYFLNYVLNSQYGRKWSWSVKTDGVSQSNINAQKLGDFLIPIPPLEEQQEIVNRVEALFAQADALEAQYVSLKARIDKLPQALLAKAFRGELVPQDPTDEPASVLLERIKAATATGGKKKKEGQTTLAFMEE